MNFYRKAIGQPTLRPYDLRHAFATLFFFLRQGGNALALQRMLGHTTMHMTKHYVHLTEADLQEQHHEASPVAFLVGGKGRVTRVE